MSQLNLNTAQYSSAPNSNNSEPPATSNPNVDGIIEHDPALQAEFNNLTPSEQSAVVQALQGGPSTASNANASQLVMETGGNGGPGIPTVLPTNSVNLTPAEQQLVNQISSLLTTQHFGGAPTVSAPVAPAASAPLGAASSGPNDPAITVVNNSNTPRYYSIEGSVGSDPENLNGQHFVLQPGQSLQVNPGAGFIGAITDHGSDPNGSGTRLEVNFGQTGQTWYDADLERGNTNVSLGPTDTSLKAADGRSALVGNTLTPYYTHGAVAGQPETALDQQSDLGTHIVSTQKMSITSN